MKYLDLTNGQEVRDYLEKIESHSNFPKLKRKERISESFLPFYAKPEMGKGSINYQLIDSYPCDLKDSNNNSFNAGFSHILKDFQDFASLEHLYGGYILFEYGVTLESLIANKNPMTSSPSPINLDRLSFMYCQGTNTEMYKKTNKLLSNGTKFAYCYFSVPIDSEGNISELKYFEPPLTPLHIHEWDFQSGMVDKFFHQKFNYSRPNDGYNHSAGIPSGFPSHYYNFPSYCSKHMEYPDVKRFNKEDFTKFRIFPFFLGLDYSVIDYFS